MPDELRLGEHAKIVVLSVAESDHQPLKYPGIFPPAGDQILREIHAAYAIVAPCAGRFPLGAGPVLGRGRRVWVAANDVCRTRGYRGALRLYDGAIRFRRADGSITADQIDPADYAQVIGEAHSAESYLKAPYFKPLGCPEGVYRVGPLARMIVPDGLGTPSADAALADYRQPFGSFPHSAFRYHYARLTEIVHALERIETLLNTAAVLDKHVRAHAAIACGGWPLKTPLHSATQPLAECSPPSKSCSTATRRSAKWFRSAVRLSKWAEASRRLRGVGSREPSVFASSWAPRRRRVYVQTAHGRTLGSRAPVLVPERRHP